MKSSGLANSLEWFLSTSLNIFLVQTFLLQSELDRIYYQFPYCWLASANMNNIHQCNFQSSDFRLVDNIAKDTLQSSSPPVPDKTTFTNLLAS